MRNVESKRRFFSSWEKQKSCNFSQNISVCWGVRNLHPSVFSRGVNVKDTTRSTSEGTGAVKPVGSTLSDGYRFMFTCWTSEAGEENVTEHKLSTAAEETLESSTQLPGFPGEPALTLRRLNQFDRIHPERVIWHLPFQPFRGRRFNFLHLNSSCRWNLDLSHFPLPRIYVLHFCTLKKEIMKRQLKEISHLVNYNSPITCIKGDTDT